MVLVFIFGITRIRFRYYSNILSNRIRDGPANAGICGSKLSLLFIPLGFIYSSSGIKKNKYRITKFLQFDAVYAQCASMREYAGIGAHQQI